MKQVQERQGPIRRQTRRTQASAMDFEQTIIPGHLYQSWLQNSSDIVSRRGRKRKRTDVMATMKIVNLMELPPIVIIGDLFTTGSRDIYYPRPLLDLWMKSTRTPRASPSGQTEHPTLPPEPSSSTPPGRQQYEDPVG
ncbi:Rad21/Rec8-like family protein, partial [Prunus dulcis]